MVGASGEEALQIACAQDKQFEEEWEGTSSTERPRLNSCYCMFVGEVPEEVKKEIGRQIGRQIGSPGSFIVLVNTE